MKKTSRKVSSLLNVDEASNVVATSIFDFKKLLLDSKSMEWTLTVLFRERLSHSYREYDFKFSLNDEPFNMKISDFEKRREELKNNKQGDLFPEEGAIKQQLKNIERDIDEVKAELEQALNDIEVFEFAGVVQKLEYKHGDTLLVFSVPSDMVEKINRNKSVFNQYKIELIRE